MIPRPSLARSDVLATRTPFVYRERVEAAPARLQEVEERLDRITRLRRKYGATSEEIIAYGAEAVTELSGIEHRDERIADLEAQIARGRVTLGHDVAALSAKRHTAAITMATAMETALVRLNMSRARYAADTSIKLAKRAIHVQRLRVPGREMARQQWEDPFPRERRGSVLCNSAASSSAQRIKGA